MGSSRSVFLRGRADVAVLTSRSSLLGSRGNSATGAPSAPKSGPPSSQGIATFPGLAPAGPAAGGPTGEASLLPQSWV